jgi:hypothetical protein
MQPYTYLIGWARQNKYYYGVQYSKKSNPDNLWKTYFTSSLVVKKFRDEFGEPDIVQVRRVFDDPLKAKLWEDRVLLSIPLDKQSIWLNTRFGQFKGIVPTASGKTKISQRAMGNTRTKGMTNAYRLEHGMKLIVGKPKGAKDTDESRKNKSESSKNMLNVRNKTTGKCERVSRSVGMSMIEGGEYQHFMTGRVKPHSEATKDKLSLVAKNRPTHHCEKCNRDITGNSNWDRHLRSLGHATR